MLHISPMPRPTVLLDGLAYVESPRWHEGRLWFAHWGTGEIVAVDLDGNSEVTGHGPPRSAADRASAGPSTGCPMAASWSRARSCCAGSRTARWSGTPTSAVSASTAGTRSSWTAAAISTSPASSSDSSPASRPRPGSSRWSPRTARRASSRTTWRSPTAWW